MHQIASNSATLFQVNLLTNTGFQMIQEKLVKIMANTQAVTLMAFRISRLVEEGNVSIGQIAMTKAFISERLREIAKWGR